ncbi:hypothetical protein DPX16_11570 [Anabarilius grahami]|uniref:Uncharacterized protein n=1 Tax=Anabarilius grahami TaxID=495550 RepID=A0A3N0YI09_ANAGA|nr:hypothetical protein DPX16_11570 [Anabarilius grahami]
MEMPDRRSARQGVTKGTKRVVQRKFTVVPVTMETCQHVVFSSDEPQRWRQKGTHWWRLACVRGCVP